MAVSDWSATPSANTTVDGINIAEGCPAGNVNGALRSIMASVRAMLNNLPSATDYLKRDGTVSVTGALTRQGAGGFLFNASGAGGKVTVQAEGQARPPAVDGDWLAEY